MMATVRGIASSDPARRSTAPPRMERTVSPMDARWSTVVRMVTSGAVELPRKDAPRLLHARQALDVRVECSLEDGRVDRDEPVVLGSVEPVGPGPTTPGDLRREPGQPQEGQQDADAGGATEDGGCRGGRRRVDGEQWCPVLGSGRAGDHGVEESCGGHDECGGTEQEATPMMASQDRLRAAGDCLMAVSFPKRWVGCADEGRSSGQSSCSVRMLVRTRGADSRPRSSTEDWTAFLTVC